MGSTSDIMRVRLTAEGIQDVMNALKKVQGGVEQTTKASQGATEALGSLGTIFAAQQLASFVKSALDAADGLFKMSQKTGIAVEQLSVFSYMGQQADVTNEDLTKGFAKLSKSLDALGSGDEKTIDAFKRIGLSAGELKGLGLDQVMLKVANAQNGFADGAGKAAVMMQIFGKSGTALIPLMNDLANNGFENAKTKLQELGLVISSDMAKQSQDFNDSMTRMEMAAQGTATQLAQGVLPELTSSLDALTKVLAKMPVVVKTFAGSFMTLGTVATAAAVAVRLLYTTIAGLGPIGLAVLAIAAASAGVIALNAAEEAAQAAAEKANASEYQRVKTGKELVEQYQKEAAALSQGSLSTKARKDHEEKLKAIRDALIKLSPTYKEALDRETGSLQDQGKALAEVSRLQSEGLENKRKAIQGEIANLEQRIRDQQVGLEKNKELPAQFQPMSNGPILGEIKRLQAIIDGLKAQLASLSKPVSTASEDATKPKKTIAAPAPKESDTEAQRKAIAAEKAAGAKREYEIQKQGLDALDTLTENAYKDGMLSLKDYLDNRASFIQMETDNEVKMLNDQIKAEEESRDKAKKESEKQIANTKINDLKNQIALKQAEGQAKLDALNRQGQQLSMEEAGKRQTTGESQLNLGLNGADNEVAKGSMTDEDAIRQKIALYQQYIPVLQAAAEEQLRLAEAENDGAGNSDDILKAQENIGKVEALKGSMHQLGESLNYVKSAAKDAIAGGLSDFLMSLGDQTTSLTDKFKNLGRSIAQALAQALAQRMALRAVEAMGFAEGGYTGPGGKYEPAGVVHKGEYVFTQQAVENVGVSALHRFHAAAKAGVLSGLSMPRRGYAEGGLVSGPAPSVGPGQTVGGKIEIGLSEGLVLKHMETPQGQKTLIKILANNRSALRGLLNS